MSSIGSRSLRQRKEVNYKVQPESSLSEVAESSASDSSLGYQPEINEMKKPQVYEDGNVDDCEEGSKCESTSNSVEDEHESEVEVKAKTTSKSKTLKHSPSSSALKVPQVKEVQSRTVKAVIAAAKESLKSTEHPNGWKKWSSDDIFQLAVELRKDITLLQVRRVFYTAAEGIRANNHNMVIQGKALNKLTVTEWILKKVVDKSKRAVAYHKRYLERRAKRLCSTCRNHIDINVQGVRCTNCKKRHIKRREAYLKAAKVRWNKTSKRQLFKSTWDRIPTKYRKPINYYILENEKIIAKAMPEILQTMDEKSSYKVGLTVSGGKRDKAYLCHVTTLTNVLKWNTDDVNIATFSEIGLAFALQKYFGESFNKVTGLGCYSGPKFNNDGSLVRSELYFRFSMPKN